MANTQLNRRTLLKAGGVALALPWLEASTLATTPVPKRLITICGTLGFYSDSWFPKTGGPEYEPSEYLAHIDQFRDSYTLFSGLEHANQSGRQAHNSEITWLTSAEHPGLAGFRNTISLDQAVGDHFGYTTRFPSIVLGTNSPQSQSYTSGGVMVPAEISPSTVFTKLFLEGDADSILREQRRLNDGASILDHLGVETQTLLPQVSHADRHKLDAYYESVRKAERNLVEVRAWQKRPKPAVDADLPSDIASNGDVVGRVASMLDLVPLILETDSSRTVSLMIQDHGVVVELEGVSVDQHNLSHHGQDEVKIDQLRIVEAEIVKKFGQLLAKLSQPDEHGVKPLDSTFILFGSNLGNANSHNPKDLPILVAGGDLPHGKHHVYQGEAKVPLSNLYLTLLQKVGLPTQSFGHSTAPLHWS